MSKRDDLAVASARGAMITVLGNATALIIGAVGVLLLARVLSPAEYGKYTIALIPSAFFILLVDWGINAALPRFLVHRRVNSDPDALRALVWSGLLVKWLISMGLAVVLVLVAAPIATQVLNRPDTGLLIQASALVVVGQPLYQTAFAIFAGYERMFFRSTLAVVQATIKATVSIILVLMGLGVAGAIGGHVMGALIAAALGIGLTWHIAGAPYSLRQLPELWPSTLQLIRFGLPLFAGGLVTSLVAQTRLILLPWYVADAVIGNFQVALYFTQLIGSITTALGVALYPTFSQYSFTQKPGSTRQAYRTAVRYSALLVLPATLLLITVAVPMIRTLYATQYPDAPGFFVLLAAPALLTGFGLYAFPAWLNSQGDTRSVFLIQVLQSSISITLAPLGLVLDGMRGYLLSLVMSQGAAVLYAITHLQRRYQLERVFPHTLRVLLAAGLAAAVTAVVLWAAAGLASALQLMGGALLYLVVILTVAPLVGAITGQDVDALTTMFGQQRVVGRVVWLILRWETIVLQQMQR
jgi:O-antigen/teichoic acid export membrane protein